MISPDKLKKLGLYDGSVSFVLKEVNSPSWYDTNKLSKLKPNCILDLGANFGSFSDWANSIWPGIKTIAVEPNPKLNKHLHELVDNPNLIVESVGFGEGEKIRLEPGRLTCVTSTKAKKGINTLSLFDLVHKYSINPNLCILKIDTEGAEQCLLDDRYDDLLSSFLAIAIEVHEWAAPLATWHNWIYRFSRDFNIVEAEDTKGKITNVKTYTLIKKNPLEKIHAYTVCVNYADYLLMIVEQNKPFFSSWNIVTSLKDEATVEVCKAYGLNYIQTDAFYSENRKFCKGCGLNELKKIVPKEKDAWYLGLDADILLPEQLKPKLSNLNPDKVYGCPRIITDNWDTLLNGQHKKGKSVPFVGYFQLIHYNKYKDLIFLEHRDASMYDTRIRSKYIKDIITLETQVVHFGPTSKYWKGREL